MSLPLVWQRLRHRPWQGLEWFMVHGGSNRGRMSIRKNPVTYQMLAKPMKITAIRVIKLPPIILNAHPSSILKSIVTCSAEFRIKLLFLTLIWSGCLILKFGVNVRTSELSAHPDCFKQFVCYDRIISPWIAVKMPYGWPNFWRF